MKPARLQSIGIEVATNYSYFAKRQEAHSPVWFVYHSSVGDAISDID